MKDDKDLRITRVMLTPEGQSLVDHIKNEASNIFIYNALKKMDENSLKGLLNGLKELTKHLSKEE